MSLSNQNRPPTDDHVGTILDKYSYYQLFKIIEKLHEIKFKEFLKLPPYVILLSHMRGCDREVNQNCRARASAEYPARLLTSTELCM